MEISAALVIGSPAVDITFETPQEFLTLADRLEHVGRVVSEYIVLDPAPWPDSIASREKVQEDQFPGLWFKYPVAHTQTQPTQAIGSAQDHLTAMAAIIRTPRTVMSALTVLRTLVVGAALARYVGNPGIDMRERVRRSLNLYLDSVNEQMHLIADFPEQVTELADRRDTIVKGARQLGWTAATPTARKGRSSLPWYIGDKPPTEMKLVDDMLSDVNAGGVGYTLYRYLSATSHVQIHGFLGFIDKSTVESLGDGVGRAGVGLDGKHLITWAMTAVGTVTLAMDHLIRYYGWPSDRWRDEVMPILNDMRATLGAPSPIRGTQLLG